MEALILRLDAPLMSMGTTVVDCHRFTADFPARSMLAGIFANALGWEHREAAQIQALQSRIVFAVRCDRTGKRLIDFQRVDLGQPHMRSGWTTRRAPEGRAGSVSDGIHIQLQHYLADALYTVALALDPAGGDPTLTDLGFALREPERPLYLGRKRCLPSAPLLVRITEGETLRSILEAEPSLLSLRYNNHGIEAQWPFEDPTPGRVAFVTDDRDWFNQIHVGRRAVRRGRMKPPTPVCP